MRKFLALLLVITVCLTVFVGCELFTALPSGMTGFFEGNIDYTSMITEVSRMFLDADYSEYKFDSNNFRSDISFELIAENNSLDLEANPIINLSLARSGGSLDFQVSSLVMDTEIEAGICISENILSINLPSIIDKPIVLTTEKNILEGLAKAETETYLNDLFNANVYRDILKNSITETDFTTEDTREIINGIDMLSRNITLTLSMSKVKLILTQILTELQKDPQLDSLSFLTEYGLDAREMVDSLLLSIGEATIEDNTQFSWTRSFIKGTLSKESVSLAQGDVTTKASFALLKYNNNYIGEIVFSSGVDSIKGNYNVVTDASGVTRSLRFTSSDTMVLALTSTTVGNKTTCNLISSDPNMSLNTESTLLKEDKSTFQFESIFNDSNSLPLAIFGVTLSANPSITVYTPSDDVYDLTNEEDMAEILNQITNWVGSSVIFEDSGMYSDDYDWDFDSYDSDYWDYGSGDNDWDWNSEDENYDWNSDSGGLSSDLTWGYEEDDLVDDGYDWGLIDPNAIEVSSSVYDDSIDYGSESFDEGIFLESETDDILQNPELLDEYPSPTSPVIDSDWQEFDYSQN